MTWAARSWLGAPTNPMVSTLSLKAARLARVSCSALYPQTVLSKPGRRTETSKRPLTTTQHNNDIESLRHELLGMISGQANDISALRSSNAQLKSSNDELISKVSGLTSSNSTLTSSNAELTSKVDGLTSSNVNLLDNVREMSSTLQSVSGQFSARWCHSLNLLFSAAYKNTPCSKPPHGPRRRSI